MNQDQQVDNDLQKAIDNITNNTSTAPVFADPVAAPSSVPEGDTGELAEPIGPFPVPQVEVVQATEQIAPIDPVEIPDLPLPPISQTAPMPEAVTESATPTSNIPLPPPPAPTIEEPAIISAPHSESSTTVHQIKKAALRDLVPLVSHLNITPSQKFNLYKDIFDDLKDYTVLDPAYHAATEITDEDERAKALLYLIESIDKM